MLNRHISKGTTISDGPAFNIEPETYYYSWILNWFLFFFPVATPGTAAKNPMQPKKSIFPIDRTE